MSSVWNTDFTGVLSYFLFVYNIIWGYAVAHLVEALRYKPEGHGFDSQWCHWNFSLTYSFRPHYGSGVDSASNRNENQEYFLGGGRRLVRGADNLTTFVCRLSWNLGASTSWNPQGLSRSVMGLLYLLALYNFIWQFCEIFMICGVNQISSNMNYKVHFI